MVQDSGLPNVMDEWLLLDRTRHGDKSAWTELLRLHQSRLTALALLITGSSDSAQDVVQEVFVRLTRVEFHHREGTLAGWLSTATWRLAVKEKDRMAKLSGLESYVEPVETVTQLEMLIKDERMLQIASAIRELSEAQRECLILRFYGEYSYEDIAALTDVPLGTVKSRLFHAVKSCREILRNKGVLDTCI